MRIASTFSRNPDFLFAALDVDTWGNLVGKMKSKKILTKLLESSLKFKKDQTGEEGEIKLLISDS